MKVDVHPSRGIGDDKCPHPERGHHPHTKCDLVGRISFIQMDPSDHGHGRLALQHAEDQLAGMTGGGRDRKLRDLGVWDRSRLLERIRKSSQAGSQDEADIGLDLGATPNLVRRSLNLLRHMGCHVCIMRGDERRNWRIAVTREPQRPRAYKSTPPVQA